MNTNSRLKKAVFLDRDGTIIHQVELMHSVEELRVFRGGSAAIRELNRRGFLVIIITNQPVVARGLIGEIGVDEIHRALIERLRVRGAKIDAVYFCPHHPEATVEKYRLQCKCRKPAPGMIVEALKKFNIDATKSFMVGDAVIDVVAGKKAGLKTILVHSGPGHARLDKQYSDIQPDFEVKNLGQAVKIIEGYAD